MYYPTLHVEDFYRGRLYVGRKTKLQHTLHWVWTKSVGAQTALRLGNRERAISKELDKENLTVHIVVTFVTVTGNKTSAILGGNN